MNEYHTEKYIQQYEHIIKLQLLTSEELSQVKKKRNQFEIAVKSSTKDPKAYIEYIKFEVALMKKFKQIEYQDENDGRALDKAMSINVKEIFRQSLKKFQDKRKIWSNYLSFAKLKFPNSVTPIYQEMLNYHHSTEDYIEAVQHEMSQNNYNVAISFLVQGMSRQKNCKELVILHIECMLRQAENQDDEKFKENTLIQANKFYAKFLKSSKDVKIHIDLLQRIQPFEFTMNLQNEIISNLLRIFPDRPEMWDALAKRHLAGIFYGEDKITEKDDFPIEERLKRMLTIYEKSFDIVGENLRKLMYNLYISKLLELDASESMNDECLKYIRQALGKSLINGCKEDSLTEEHFIYCLKLRILYKEKYQNEIEDMLDKGSHLYPNSMDFYEIAIKYYLELKSYENISILFKYAVRINEKYTVELYKFLCSLYLTNPKDKERAKNLMLEAVRSNNKKLSASFQPYMIEHYAMTDSIEKARELFSSFINSKAAASLSVDFFKTMIKMEQIQMQPNSKIIKNCFERAISENFSKQNPEIWIEYIKYLWTQGKFTESNNLHKRAKIMLKNDLTKVEEFELKFTLLKNEFDMNADIKDELIIE